MYKYHCLNPISKIGLDQLPIKDYQETESFEDADAILVRSAAMHELQLSDKVKAVARAGAGVNNIPLDSYAQKGIVVFNTPGANANGVKEMVIAGMLLAARDIVGGVQWVESEKENPDIAKLVEKQKKHYAGTEIQGKKLGVIGLGAIGVLVANAAVHLGMEVYGYDPFISVDAAWNLSRSIHHSQDASELYKECDYITIHVPLLDSTRGMIGEEAFLQMKDGAVILNFARDVLVDEEALLKALESGKVRKYVTDFANPTILKGKNVLVTPHLGASTEESEDNCAVMAAKEIRDYLENGNIKNSVNYPNCDAGICESAGRLAINHKNKVHMISQFSSVIGDAGLNISDMTNKSRGDYAYTIFDLSTKVDESILPQLESIEGVLKVRIVK